MNQTSLKSYFSKMQELDESTVELLVNNFEEVEYPKNFKLYSEGKVCKKVWVVKQGVVGYFFQSVEKEHLAWIDMEGEIVGSIRSISSGFAANETAKLLEDAVLYELDFRIIENLLPESIELEHFKAVVYQNYFTELEKRVRMLQSMDAKERYRQIIEHKPALLQRISLQNLSSFIGVTPETLSRIRADIS